MCDESIEKMVGINRYLPIERLSYANGKSIEDNIKDINAKRNHGFMSDDVWYVKESSIDQALFDNLYDRYDNLAILAKENEQVVDNELFTKRTEEDEAWLCSRIQYGLNHNKERALELTRSFMDEARESVVIYRNKTKAQLKRQEWAMTMLLFTKIAMVVLFIVKCSFIMTTGFPN